MPFAEKTAWIMSLALIVGGAEYFRTVLSVSAGLGAIAEPNIGLIVRYTIVLVVIAIVGHVVAASSSPSDANAAADERDKRITERAGHLSGIVFGLGVVPSLGVYLFLQQGSLLFYGVFASLMISQIAEYVIQIVLYRTAVR